MYEIIFSISYLSGKAVVTLALTSRQLCFVNDTCKCNKWNILSNRSTCQIFDSHRLKHVLYSLETFHVLAAAASAGRDVKSD